LENGEIRIALRYLKYKLGFGEIAPDPDNLVDVKDSSDLLKMPQFDEKTDITKDSKMGRPILDGHIIDIKPGIYQGKEVKAPDWDVLELQWNLLRMTCITAAAEPEDEDEEDDDPEVATAAWLEGISDEYEQMEVVPALGFTTEEEEEMNEQY